MRRFLLPIVLSATPAMAADQAGRLIAALSGDWNGDGSADAVLLVQGADEAADLQVYLGDFLGLELKYTVPGAVYAGGLAGQTPGLVALSATSFAITSQQTGIGRTPWTARVTVAYRDGGFVVAGYTYDFYDRLDPDHHGACDVNLLTGDFDLRVAPQDGSATINRHGRATPHGFDLSQLDVDWTSPVCRDVFR